MKNAATIFIVLAVSLSVLLLAGCDKDEDLKVEENSLTGEWRIMEYRFECWLEKHFVSERIKTIDDACEYVRKENIATERKREEVGAWKDSKCNPTKGGS